MNTNRQLHRSTAVVTGTVILTAMVALPAYARPDAGAARVSHSTPAADGGRCWLARVGTQFVRCDDLTGNGVSAPGFVSQR